MPGTSRTARRPVRRSAKASRRSGSSMTPRQQREVAGVLLIGAGLFVLVAAVGVGGENLRGAREAIQAAVGYGWPLLALAMLIGGGALAYPKTPEPSWLKLGAGAVSVLALFGLASLAHGPTGGGLGEGIAWLSTRAGSVGGLLLLLIALLVGLTVVGVSVIAAGGKAVGVGRTAYGGRHHLMRVREVVGFARGHLTRLSALANSTTSQLGAEPSATALGERVEGASGPGDDAAGVERALAAARLRVEHEATGDAGSAGPALDRVIGDWDDEQEVAWKLPALSLLDAATAKKERQQEELKRVGKLIESTLVTFGVHARVVGANQGPAVTQYELQPAAGVLVRKVVSLQNDLALALAASPIRLEAPIPGKSLIGIEVPNKISTLVPIREGVEAPGFIGGRNHLGVVLGADVGGEQVSVDLTRMPHLLLAGATGQGKSVCINTLIASLLLRLTPAQLRLVMIDPKRVELQQYNGLPHLARPVIVEPHEAAGALRWAVVEMNRRYKLLAKASVRNIGAYNPKAVAAGQPALPYVVIVIDELADLMMVAAGEIEELVCRIAQLARAVGIHLVIATQRPSTDIITGLIKANVPSRIAFAVGSQVDSRVILDQVGAEKLLGKGDMLFSPVDGKTVRLQGAFISDREVESLVAFWRGQGEPRYVEMEIAPPEDGPEEQPTRALDPMFARAARAVSAEGAASVSLVQRKFNVGYSRAGRIVDQLAEHLVVGSYQGSKSREVLMNLPDVDELLERLGVEG